MCAGPSRRSVQEALCQAIFLLLFAGRDANGARPAAIMVGDATRAGDSWCTVPEVSASAPLSNIVKNRHNPPLWAAARRL